MDMLTSRTIESSILALDALSERHSMISANIANAETPGYKRVDLKFEEQLAGIIKEDRDKENKRQAFSLGLLYSRSQFEEYMAGNGSAANNEDSPRTKKYIDNAINSYKEFKPEQVNNDYVSEKADGNNVNIEYEMAELSKNGMKYTALTTLLQKKFQGLGDAIKGGGM